MALKTLIYNKSTKRIARTNFKELSKKNNEGVKINSVEENQEKYLNIGICKRRLRFDEDLISLYKMLNVKVGVN